MNKNNQKNKVVDLSEVRKNKEQKSAPSIGLALGSEESTVYMTIFDLKTKDSIFDVRPNAITEGSIRSWLPKLSPEINHVLSAVMSVYSDYKVEGLPIPLPLLTMLTIAGSAGMPREDVTDQVVGVIHQVFLDDMQVLRTALSEGKSVPGKRSASDLAKIEYVYKSMLPLENERVKEFILSGADILDPVMASGIIHEPLSLSKGRYVLTVGKDYNGSLALYVVEEGGQPVLELSDNVLICPLELQDYLQAHVEAMDTSDSIAGLLQRMEEITESIASGEGIEEPFIMQAIFVFILDAMALSASLQSEEGDFPDILTSLHPNIYYSLLSTFGKEATELEASLREDIESSYSEFITNNDLPSEIFPAYLKEVEDAKVHTLH